MTYKKIFSSKTKIINQYEYRLSFIQSFPNINTTTTKSSARFNDIKLIRTRQQLNYSIISR